MVEFYPMTEPRPHPVYRYTVHWATVADRRGRHVEQCGPFRHRAEAMAKAELMAAARNGHLAGMPHQLGALLNRKAAAPLKPAKPQEPCDVGLFSDDAAQLDLVDMARRDR